MKHSAIMHDNESQQFNLIINGSVAKIEYHITNNIFELYHSEVPFELRGKGIGKQLVEQTFIYLNENNLKGKAICSFVKKIARENHQWHKFL